MPLFNYGGVECMVLLNAMQRQRAGQRRN